MDYISKVNTSTYAISGPRRAQITQKFVAYLVHIGVAYKFYSKEAYGAFSYIVEIDTQKTPVDSAASAVIEGAAGMLNFLYRETK